MLIQGCKFVTQLDGEAARCRAQFVPVVVVVVVGFGQVCPMNVLNLGELRVHWRINGCRDSWGNSRGLDIVSSRNYLLHVNTESSGIRLALP